MKRLMHGGLRLTATQAGLGVGLFLTAGQAAAQQQVYPQQPAQAYPAPQQAPAAQTYPAAPAAQPAYAAPQPAYAPPAPTPAAAPASAADATDDQKMWIGHVGLGWLGTVPVSIGTTAAGGLGPTTSVPIVGVRYWASPTLGFDVGLGFITTSSSSTDASGASVDGPSTTGFALHAGLPLVLGSTKHMSVQLIPEANIAFGSTSSQTDAGGGMLVDVSQSGLHVNVGARAGAEVFFGFIGLPALSLEGSAGVYLSALSSKTEVAGVSTKASALVISTSSIAQPWDIFRSDVAARYYF